ncbi:efflux RND transporter periplasmic adaptor subunit [Citreimonas sp.]|uniref:efflux RND transporter periplasmic adaptor subunit n=1 Tax=Citreimonas sp. TaxID=3036715 RepID=UPI0040598514
MRFLGKSLLGLFLLSLTLGLIVFAGVLVRDAVQVRMADEPRTPEAQERVFAVSAVTVTPDTETPVLTAFGDAQSRRTLELRSAAAGRIVELASEFVEGGRVAEGQLLARIDPSEAEAALSRAESDLIDARAELREAERAVDLARDELTFARDQVGLREAALQRQRDLIDRNVGTASALEAAELALSTAQQAVLSRRQAVASAEARIDQATTALSRAEIARDETARRVADTEIRAAFAGRLSDVPVVEGRLVSANEQLARLVDPDALEVAFQVSTTQYLRLLDDSGLRQADATVTLGAGEDAVTTAARLTREGAAVGEGQVGRRLFAELRDAQGFRPGDFVMVTVSEPPLENVARLPATAIDAAGTVLVVDDDDRLRPVSVTILRRQGDDVLIAADDLDGAQVVAQRTPLLGEGIKVRVLQGPDARATGGMVAIDDTRRAALRALVEGDTALPDAARSRILAQLDAPQVPAAVIARIEARRDG